MRSANRGTHKVLETQTLDPLATDLQLLQGVVTLLLWEVGW